MITNPEALSYLPEAEKALVNIIRLLIEEKINGSNNYQSNAENDISGR